MKILIAGSHGMIGSAVTRHLLENGHEIVRLVRHTSGSGETWWDPDAGKIHTSGLDGFEGVVNLATTPWPMRWTAKVKHRMSANRAGTNRLLAEALARREDKPSVLVCASGIGYYPPSGDMVITEDSPAGGSFLTNLNRDGESATAPASQSGIRVVHLRIPMVLGGERLRMLGFQAGSRQQWMSWIGLDEMASIIEFALKTTSLSGPVNCVSPNPLRLTEFADVSTHTLNQKPGGVMPTFIVKLIMREMGEEFLLASRRARPSKLLAAGYHFRFPDLEAALTYELECR